MLHLVNLICSLVKSCLILTLIRLLSTAFGWEFGVSKQYLRLLEWVFQVGQQRIEKVESEIKLHKRNTDQVQLGTAEDEDDDDGDGDELNTNEARPRTVDLEKSSQLCNGQRNQVVMPRRECANLIERPTGLSCQFSEKIELQRSQQTHITRRISTPDGPPVFLLDDDEFSPSSSDNANNSEPSYQHEFHLIDATRLVVKGISSIIDDQVTKRFTPEQLKTWNLLTRTNGKNYQFMSSSLGLCWLFGLLVRYSILLPLRIVFTVTGFLWLITTMTLIGLLPKSLRAKPFRLMSLMSFRMLSCGITSRLAYHNQQYRAKAGDICVANHTSPLDVVLLACDNCYALVGQRHGGLLGVLELALSRATNHVWFDRSEMKDRQLVTRRLKEHLSCKKNLPVLIFPEGTCINNSAVMMFRKGSFETTDRVCPVAIKYDARFGDPFWNSSKQTYVQYLLMMMSSWAIKCDVWYLPPMERLVGESSAEFANRVKAEIAKQGGLVDLAWDGQLKRSSIKPTWLHQQQEDYVKRLKLE